MLGFAKRFALAAAVALAAPSVSAHAENGTSNTKILAFPEAQGAGAYAVGGRFGSVYRVTNLNASGPGSLADAVSQSNHIVVFEVSGIIDLSGGKPGKHGRLDIDHPNITVAGQTAPGEGICLKNGMLAISAGDVIVRHIRSRRGFIADGDSGDSIEVKPKLTENAKKGEGTEPDVFAKIQQKKAERGKSDKMKEPAKIENIILDHLSASWATDENLTLTHPNFTTAQYCIASEGLDYTNSKQTPPNHSEGSLWGVSAPDGRSTMHHMLYAHNRLRNPRTTGGGMPPAILEFRNGVVYDASEYFSHTGSEAVYLNWVDNYYKAGPSTPPALRGNIFEFMHNTDCRAFFDGNVIDGMADRTRDNWLAVAFRKDQSAQHRSKTRVDQPLGEKLVRRQSAAEAYEEVLQSAGATLPARDSVDLRIVREVRAGTGHVINKETDLPAEDRWPVYHCLPAPADSDGDGIPDYWETQFGLNPHDASDSMKITAGGYANVEHYINNTDPTGGNTPIVFISAAVSRASRSKNQDGMVLIRRTGNTASPLSVRFAFDGSAIANTDYHLVTNIITIPAGATSASIAVRPVTTQDFKDERTVVIRLETGRADYHVGCPSASMVVIQK